MTKCSRASIHGPALALATLTGEAATGRPAPLCEGCVRQVVTGWADATRHGIDLVLNLEPVVA